MSIESDIFKGFNVDLNKLEKYGFVKNDDKYEYSKKIMNTFNANITINKDGNVFGQIIDLDVDEEYINYRIDNTIGKFASNIREEYKKILIDIRNNCFIKDYFINNQTNRITKYIIDKYNAEPEFLWNKDPGCGVFRNKDNNKWFGIIMNINKSKIDNENKDVEIINIKCCEDNINKLIKKNGFYKGYHMNKKRWITIILDDNISDSDIINLIDESYNLVSEPLMWLVPANPKYYDVINCFNNTDIIEWKQSSDIHVNDIIFIYVTAPYSTIMYKCKVVEVNIPYEYYDKHLSIKKIIRIKLLKKYKGDEYTFEKLNKMGIKAIRGLRKISKEVKIK